MDFTNKVFPTSVGMNRGSNTFIEITFCVPHKRGDEPRHIKNIG